MIRRVVLFLAFYLVGLNATETPFGAGTREYFSSGYDPLWISTLKPRADKIDGYREMKKIIGGKASDFLAARLGKSYWTEEVAPVVFDALYSSVAAEASGHLSLRHPSSILDEAASGLVASGKNRLTVVSQKNFPNLPVVGNFVEDLAKSQHLNLRGGKVHYQMRMRKRLAPEFKLGQFSLSGGTEAYLNGRTVSKTSVASVGYKGVGSSYRVQLYGRNIRFDVSWSPIDLRLDWNPQVVKFDLKLDLGSWL